MITALTTTHDRPDAMRLCVKWISEQTIKPDVWVVADDGKVKWSGAHIDGVTVVHVTASPGPQGYLSLIGNMRRGLRASEGASVVVVFEDDDVYANNHIEVQLLNLRERKATGCRVLNYYNLKSRSWHVTYNNCAALCNTAFIGSMISTMLDACDEAELQRTKNIDKLFWKVAGIENTHDEVTVTGIKGMPGSAGIGIGHHPNSEWNYDPDMNKLKEWIGNAVEFYK